MPVPPPVSRKVLLVTGSPDEREMYAETLRRQGFCTLQAETAADAYRLASEVPPAVVVTDARLGGGEAGLDLTRRLKQSHPTRRVPVVLLTAHVFNADREAAARAGCDLFMPKPCLPDVLASAISALLARRR